MSIIALILLAFLFGLILSASSDLYEHIKIRVKRRREKKNGNTPANVL